MTTGSARTLEMIQVDRDARARKWARRILYAGLAGWGLELDAFALMVLVDPPTHGAEVTGFQVACIVVMCVGGAIGVLAFLVSLVGLIRKGTRRMYLTPFIANVIGWVSNAAFGIIWSELVFKR